MINTDSDSGRGSNDIDKELWICFFSLLLLHHRHHFQSLSTHFGLATFRWRYRKLVRFLSGKKFNQCVIEISTWTGSVSTIWPSFEHLTDETNRFGGCRKWILWYLVNLSKCSIMSIQWVLISFHKLSLNNEKKEKILIKTENNWKLKSNSYLLHWNEYYNAHLYSLPKIYFSRGLPVLTPALILVKWEKKIIHSAMKSWLISWLHHSTDVIGHEWFLFLLRECFKIMKKRRFKHLVIPTAVIVAFIILCINQLKASPLLCYEVRWKRQNNCLKQYIYYLVYTSIPMPIPM